ncbi:MAG: AraC family transcriptional regulator [Gemmatimonadota bacterium]|nr:AraC family transcriptional regulator [Gemmatimonadota bacterium]
MALIALLDDPGGSSQELARCLNASFAVTTARTEDGLERLIRERPAVAAVVGLQSCATTGCNPSVLDRLERSFPRLPVVVWVGARPDPNALLQVGRHSSVRLCTVGHSGGGRSLEQTLRRAMAHGPSRIPGLLGRTAPRWTLSVLRRVVDTVEACWTVDLLASDLGLRRQELNQRLRGTGLPSAGRLLHWVRVFYAAWWSGEPGRTGVSISHQLEYASSQSFVRAVRTLLGVTPGRIADLGGLDWAWLRFLADHPGLVAARPRIHVWETLPANRERRGQGLYSPDQSHLRRPA